MTPTQEPPVNGASQVRHFIREDREGILQEWQALVQQLPDARKLDPKALIDHLPALLERVAVLSEELAAGEAGRLPSEVVERHAVDRMDEGFDLPEIVAEYALLRDCLVRRWVARHPPTEALPGVVVLDRAVDRAIAASVERYIHVAHLRLQSLDRVSTVALESRSLPDLLARLLEVFVHTIASADTAIILLREGDALRVRAVLGLEQNAARGSTLQIGEDFAGAIAAERRPKLLRPASPEAPQQHGVGRVVGVRALFGVPLMDAGEVIGVAQIGSRSAYDFSEQAQRLFIALADRASTAMSQQLLRERAETRAAELAAEIERRRELEAAVSALHDFVFLYDREGRFTWANAKMLESMMRSLSDITGKTLAELGYRQELVELTRRNLVEAFAGHTVQGELKEKATSTGLLRDWEYVLTPVDGGDGRVQAVAGMVRDITERKRAEEQQRFLKRASEVLSGSLQRDEIVAALQRLVVPDFADCCSVELVNEAGISEQVALHHVDAGLAAAARRGSTCVTPTIAEVLRTMKPKLLSELPPDVMPGLGLCSAIIVPLIARGCSIGLISLGLTARGRYRHNDLEVAEELATRAAMALEHARLYREAQAAVRARESVLAVVSHDLKNPLGAIGMSTGLLLRRPGSDEDLQRHLHIIRRSTERMVHLIDALLDMGSVQAGRLAVVKGRHRAQALVDEAVELHAPAAAEKGIALECDTALGDALLNCDRDRVLQVFANLIGNALKFCEPGDRVTVRGERREGWVQFGVTDTGPGIAPADLPQIFEPYWSAQRHARQGTGLGLFITRGIIETHGGKIWAESRPGQGSAFHFTLPLAR